MKSLFINQFKRITYYNIFYIWDHEHESSENQALITGTEGMALFGNIWMININLFII